MQLNVTNVICPDSTNNAKIIQERKEVDLIRKNFMTKVGIKTLIKQSFNFSVILGQNVRKHEFEPLLFQLSLVLI